MAEANPFDQFDTPTEPVAIAPQPQPAPQAQPASEGFTRPVATGEQPGLIGDTARGVVKGVRDFGQSVLDLTGDVAQGLGLPGADQGERIQLPEVTPPERLPGQIAEPITQFVSGLLPVSRAAQALGWAARGAGFTRAAAVGAGADFIAFDQAEERLSNMLVELDNPILSNAVTQYLAADPDDHWAEGRFKNVLEGGGLGVAAEGIFRSVRALAKARKVKAEGGDPEEFMRAQEPELRAILEDTIEAPAAGPSMRAAEGTQVDRRLHQAVWEAAEEMQVRGIDPEQLPLPSDMKAFSSDEISSTITSMANAIRNQTGWTWDNAQSRNAVYDLARETGQDATKLINDMASLGGMRDEIAPRIVAARLLEAGAARNFAAVSRLFDNGTVGVDEAMAAFDILNRTTASVREIGSTMGRGLQAFQVPISGQAWSEQARTLSDMVKNHQAYGGNMEDFFRNVGRTLNDNPTGVRQMVAAVAKHRYWEVAGEYWVNALLSGPRTHVINSLSNGIKMFSQPLSDSIGRALIGDLSGSAEALSMYAHFGRHAYESVKLMGQAFKKGDNILDPFHRLADPSMPPPAQGVIPGALGQAVRTPMRALGAADEFWKQIQYRAYVTSTATREGMRKGLKGQDLQDFVNNRFTNAFDPQTGQGIDERALRYVQEQTFTNDLEHGIARRIQQMVQEYPMLRQLFPFVRTPAQLLREAFRHVPVIGALSRRQQEMWRTGGNARATLVGKQAMGSMILGAGAMLAYNGNLTGAGPRDPAVRKTWLDAGNKPYSVRVGDQWFSYERLDPLGMVMGTLADFTEIAGELTEGQANEVGAAMMVAFVEDLMSGDLDPVTEGLAQFSASMARNLTSKVYLQGITQFLEVVSSGDADETARFIDGHLASYIPNFFRQTNPDPHFREVRTLVDHFRSRVPGFGPFEGSEALDPRYDLFGRATVRTGTAVERALNPVSRSGLPSDPVLNELVRLGHPFPPAPTSVGAVDLSTFRSEKHPKTAYARFNELLAETGIHERLKAFIQSPGYQSLSDNISMGFSDPTYKGSKAAVIQGMLTGARGEALARLKSEEGWTSKRGLSLQEALLNDQYNRGLAGGPDAILRPTR